MTCQFLTDYIAVQTQSNGTFIHDQSVVRSYPKKKKNADRKHVAKELKLNLQSTKI